MKNNMLHLGATATLTALLSLTTHAATLFSDNFSTLNDAAWTHLSAFAMSTGQTWDATTGSYRLTAPANGYNPGTGKYGFVGSVATGVTLSDGIVQSDVLTFQGGGATQSPFGALGLGTRLNNLSSPLGLTGYGLAYEPYGNSGGPTLRLQRLGPPSIFNSLAVVNVNLTPGNQYTITLEASGSSITGSIWNFGQVGTGLVGQVSAVDATYASGSVGLLGVTQAPMPTADTTWDNFLVVVPEPGTGLLLALGLCGALARRGFGSKRP